MVARGTAAKIIPPQTAVITVDTKNLKQGRYMNLSVMHFASVEVLYL